MRKLVLLLFACFLLSISVQAQVTCDDPDEQPDILDTIDTVSEVDYGLTPRTDVCVNDKNGYQRDPSNWVREYFCEGDPEQRKSNDYDCTRYGYDRCEGGRCVGDTSASTTTTPSAPKVEPARCGDKRVQSELGEQCDPPDSICYGDDGTIGLCGRPNDAGFGGCQCKLYGVDKDDAPVEEPEEEIELEVVEEPEFTTQEVEEVTTVEEDIEELGNDLNRAPLPSDDFKEYEPPKGIGITRSITNGVKSLFSWIWGWF